MNEFNEILVYVPYFEKRVEWEHFSSESKAHLASDWACENEWTALWIQE